MKSSIVSHYLAGILIFLKAKCPVFDNFESDPKICKEDQN